MSSVEEITAMIYRYCELFDSGEFDEFAAQFEHGRMGGREPGSASLRRWIDENVILYDGSPGTRHLTTNLIVEVDEQAGTAKARSYVTVLHAADGYPLALVGSAEYHDQFERVDGAWRWAAREVVNQVHGDTSRHVRRASQTGD